MTIYFPPDLARKLSVYCAFNGEDLSSVVVRAVDRLLHDADVER
jgi:hypothetical protein